MLIWRTDSTSLSLTGLLLMRGRRHKIESSKLSIIMKLFSRGKECCREKELSIGSFKLSLIFLRPVLVKYLRSTSKLLPEIERGAESLKEAERPALIVSWDPTQCLIHPWDHRSTQFPQIWVLILLRMKGHQGFSILMHHLLTSTSQDQELLL